MNLGKSIPFSVSRFFIWNGERSYCPTVRGAVGNTIAETTVNITIQNSLNLGEPRLLMAAPETRETASLPPSCAVLHLDERNHFDGSNGSDLFSFSNYCWMEFFAGGLKVMVMYWLTLKVRQCQTENTILKTWNQQPQDYTGIPSWWGEWVTSELKKEKLSK